MDKIICSPKSWQEVQDYAKQTTSQLPNRSRATGHGFVAS